MTNAISRGNPHTWLDAGGARMVLAIGLLLMAVFATANGGELAGSQWKGRKVAVFGDSISDPNIRNWKHWWAHLADMTGIDPHVYAKNGWQWGGVPRQIDMMEAEGLKPDAILIFMGTNDFNLDVPLGEWWSVVDEKVNRDGKEVVCRKRIHDLTADTVRGRINIALKRLKHGYPDCQVVLLTPIHRGYFTCGRTNVQPDEAYANNLGHWIDDYVRCVKEAGPIWSVPVIDLHGESGLYPSDPSFGKCFNRADTDLLHPNTEGHRRLAALIAAKLSALPVLRENETVPVVSRPPLGPEVCPRPRKMTVRDGWFHLDGRGAVTVACPDAHATDWVSRHLKAWFGKCPSVVSAAGGADLDAEAYELEVGADGIRISAATLAGVRYAMSTLRQVAMPARSTLRTDHWIAPFSSVKDAPALAWRGLHLCWFPETKPAEIERLVRLAAYMKFNYAIIESWGTFRSEKFPWLGWPDGSMTKKELARLKSIADDLGIVLIPQVNVFGHASHSRGCTGKHATLDFAPEYAPLFEPVMGWNWCLSNPETKRVLFEFVGELHEAFGNPPYFHIGCDEAMSPSCPECSKGRYPDKVVSHIRDMAELLGKRGARAMIWHDMFIAGGDPRFPCDYANGTVESAESITNLPRSVVICDWNYQWKRSPDGTYPSLDYFTGLGFTTLTCPWTKPDNIAAQGRYARERGFGGFLGTTWNTTQGPELRELLVCDAHAAWGTDPSAFREPWHARTMTLLRTVVNDMEEKDYTLFGTYRHQVPVSGFPE